MARDLQTLPWAPGFNTYLVAMVTKTGGRFRYLAAHAPVGTLPRLLGKRGNTPGVARHLRPTLQRYGRKRVVGEFG